MTGSGTQTDPYIVDNWADFVTAITTADAYVAFPEGGGSIDMNDAAPEGVSCIIPTCAYVQGNGWEINNIHLDDNALFYRIDGTTIFDNLKFLKMYVSYTSGSATSKMGIFEMYTSNIQFKNCIFGGILFSTGGSLCISYSSYQAGTVFYSCSMYFKCDGTIQPFDGNYSSVGFKHSRLNLLGTCTDIDVKIDNSELTGDITAVSSNAITILSGSARSCINAVLSGFSSVSYSGTLASAVLINTDNISDGTTVSDTLNKCTTAQLGNAEYLSSLGFPIGVD